MVGLDVVERGIAVLVVKSHHPAETVEIGRKLGRLLPPGAVIALSGNLGAGKTLLAQGILKGLGVNQFATSPTFTLIKEYYQGRLPVYHMDMYRIEDIHEADELGIEDYFYGEGVSIIEWAERIEALLPADHLMIVLERVPDWDEKTRRISFFPHGEEYEGIVRKLERGE